MDILNATLEDLKKYRPDLCDMLLDEFLKASSQEAPKKPASPIIEEVKAVEGVKKGDAIRWNYTKEEGIVVGFENEDGISNIIVQRYNGSKIFFENDRCSVSLYGVYAGKRSRIYSGFASVTVKRAWSTGFASGLKRKLVRRVMRARSGTPSLSRQPGAQHHTRVAGCVSR